jgi:hypothetical protein
MARKRVLGQSAALTESPQAADVDLAAVYTAAGKLLRELRQSHCGLRNEDSSIDCPDARAGIDRLRPRSTISYRIVLAIV